MPAQVARQAPPGWRTSPRLRTRPPLGPPRLIRRHSPGWGHGIFATTPMAKGAMVATMMQPWQVRGVDYAMWRGLPHDLVVFVGDVTFFLQQPVTKRAWLRFGWDPGGAVAMRGCEQRSAAACA